MTFLVGHQVVCISEQHNSLYTGRNVPRAGNVYTVRWLGEDEIMLEEIRNDATWVEHSETLVVTFQEPTFFLEDFRPVVTRKTDISAFKALLKTEKQSEDA